MKGEWRKVSLVGSITNRLWGALVVGRPAVGCAFGGTGVLTPNEADVGDMAVIEVPRAK